MYLSLNRRTLIQRVKAVMGGELIFMLSALVVNAGNYYYNLFLGRAVGPEVFAETGLIVTFLLILSFLGMTLQLTAAKYIVEMEGTDRRGLQATLSGISLLIGLSLAIMLWQGSEMVGSFFNIRSESIIPAFAIGITTYFYLSVMRGVLQGQQHFKRLAFSYQAEMFVRFVVTLVLIFGFDVSAPLSVSLAISASILAGAMVCGKPVLFNESFPVKQSRPIVVFLLFTLGYELVQMVINYFDLLLVKHHFDAFQAGQYTSLSLIGRMVYFIAWMFVMLLLPHVVNARKAGKPCKHLLTQYLAAIGLFVAIAVTGCYLFSEELVLIMFGGQYLAISPLLWKYALATGLFALGNIFIYYHLSLENYTPVGIAAFFAALMVVTLGSYHDSITLVVTVQIIFMGLALVAQFLYHFVKTTHYRNRLFIYRSVPSTHRNISYKEDCHGKFA
ncbi:MAG: oligosaccharide flippase family protein [Bacteroidota bacterium]